jgi:hypothetical protein
MNSAKILLLLGGTAGAASVKRILCYSYLAISFLLWAFFPSLLQAQDNPVQRSAYTVVTAEFKGKKYFLAVKYKDQESIQIPGGLFAFNVDQDWPENKAAIALAHTTGISLHPYDMADVMYIDSHDEVLHSFVFTTLYSAHFKTVEPTNDFDKNKELLLKIFEQGEQRNGSFRLHIGSTSVDDLALLPIPDKVLKTRLPVRSPFTTGFKETIEGVVKLAKETPFFTRYAKTITTR